MPDDMTLIEWMALELGLFVMLVIAMSIILANIYATLAEVKRVAGAIRIYVAVGAHANEVERRRGMPVNTHRRTPTRERC